MELTEREMKKARKEERDFLKESCIAAMKQMARTQVLITSLHEINRTLTNREAIRCVPYDRIKEPSETYSAILHETLTDAMKRVLMFGVLTEDQDIKQEAFRMCMEEMFADRDGVKMSIMGYLELEGRGRGGYYEDEENAFRQQIEEAVRRELGVYEDG